MTYEDIQMLVNIYNTLLSVHTCGEDSFTMTDSMRALYKFIDNKQKEYIEKQKENKEV